jgi:hypothetical protein
MDEALRSDQETGPIRLTMQDRAALEVLDSGWRKFPISPGSRQSWDEESQKCGFAYALSLAREDVPKITALFNSFPQELGLESILINLRHRRLLVVPKHTLETLRGYMRPQKSHDREAQVA